MSTMSTELFVVTLALVGVVIVIAALLSGLVERSGLPQVVVFLALGVVVGPAGFGLLDVTLTSPVLRVVATLSLVLVLFTDAIAIDLGEARRRGPPSSARPSRRPIRCCCAACCGGATCRATRGTRCNWRVA